MERSIEGFRPPEGVTSAGNVTFLSSCHQRSRCPCQSGARKACLAILLFPPAKTPQADPGASVPLINP